METFHLISYKNDKIETQRLDFRDSSPNYWYILAHDVPLIAPVIAKQSLYWRDLSFS